MSIAISQNLIKFNINAISIESNFFLRFIKFISILFLLPRNFVRIFTKFHFVAIISKHIIFYPSPSSLSYAWSFGSLAGLSLSIQLCSGLFLTLYYTPHVDIAFSSIEFIMRDVHNGWLIRYIHSNGASMFFIVVYAHMCRGIYYGSYMRPRRALWCSGVILLLLMMATAFTGYVLPWGQMSLWGATVITNMLTVIPVAGTFIVEWIWGGYTIAKPTLYRFYTVHFILPFFIIGMTFIHLILLHKVGSGNVIGVDTNLDDITFHPYMISKDLVALNVYLIVFSVMVFYYPNVLNHPDNYVPANPMKTPPHVVPEWYFLPYYVMLRTFPTKTTGILAMFSSLLILFSIPFTEASKVRCADYRPIFKVFFWVFIYDFAILLWVGQKSIKDMRTFYDFAGEYSTAYYFVFFLLVFPIVGRVENYLGTYPVVKKL